MGERSVSYALSPQRIATSWDDDELLSAPGVTAALDPLRWAEYYANVELASDRSFFADIRIVPPGELLLVGPESVERRALRRPRLDLRVELSGWEAYVERFSELLRQAVRRQLADIDTVAVMMSGGLDSAPIAATAAHELAAGGARRVLALSWRVDDAEADEQRLVEATVDEAGLDLAWVDCRDAEPWSDLARWPVHPAAPGQTPYRWFHQRTYEAAAARGHSVLLTGFSGDSLYLGARRWAWDLFADRGPGAAIDRLRSLARTIGWRQTLRSHVFSPLLPRGGSLLGEALPPYLTAAARERLATRRRYPEDVLRARRPQQARRVLALLDAQAGHRERHYTSAFGLDTRTPLRDLDLVEFLLAAPSHLLLQGEETRPVMRAAMRGVLPESVRTRRGKSSFYAIAERGYEAAQRTWAGPLLRSPRALWRGVVEEAEIERWLNEPLDRAWAQTGFLQCVNGELWRFKRSGGDLASLAAEH